MLIMGGKTLINFYDVQAENPEVVKGCIKIQQVFEEFFQ